MTTPLTRRALRVGLLAYLLLVLLPPLLQLLHVLALGWWVATAFLWGPWAFLLVFTALSVLARLAWGGRAR